ncbi:MAG TPA: 16S rRNA (cytosine(1402)-N(4))-methyltransferase RsmH [Acidimicrobiales bacterium]|nr:16S rRNA (cytosine(1402)-N(4))-methyltransferase RsmH [Acidimicrobiales bacterium]
MGQRFEHVPVMLDEVLEVFEGLPDGLAIDATVGGAGHAQAILEEHPGWDLVALDRDADAVAAATERLAPYGTRASVYRARFDDLRVVVSASTAVARPVVAVLFDLGVSSHQLDVAERGFSYRSSGPLDMRMDVGEGHRASDVVNGASEEALAALFAEHGEERFARRIARAIVAQRPVESTGRLAEIVSDAIPAAARRRGHPARRVFQALRVAVNAELELLGPAIDDALALLAPGGRIVVLAYHSGEDRIVKQHLRDASTGGCVCPPGLPCVCGAEPIARLLMRGARMASPAEIAENPRAESARMRAAERLDATHRPGARRP